MADAGYGSYRLHDAILQSTNRSYGFRTRTWFYGRRRTCKILCFIWRKYIRSLKAIYYKADLHNIIVIMRVLYLARIKTTALTVYLYVRCFL